MPTNLPTDGEISVRLHKRPTICPLRKKTTFDGQIVDLPTLGGQIVNLPTLVQNALQIAHHRNTGYPKYKMNAHQFAHLTNRTNTANDLPTTDIQNERPQI